MNLEIISVYNDKIYQKATIQEASRKIEKEIIERVIKQLEQERLKL